MTDTMNNDEAKLVATLRCAFGLSSEQIAKMLYMLWKPGRAKELGGSGEPYDVGSTLLKHAEKQLRLSNGELDHLSLEECVCQKCGHEEFYLTSLVDTGKQCAKCKEPHSVFLPPIELWDPED